MKVSSGINPANRFGKPVGRSIEALFHTKYQAKNLPAAKKLP
jgi:hypothetical protein